MKSYFNLNISRTVRHTGYLIWTLVSQVVDSGISRVVFYPLLVYLVGKEEFGVFAIAQSVVLIIGTSPGDGLAPGC
jgi:O-antigen/teichoic acid export membrane protein